MKFHFLLFLLILGSCRSTPVKVRCELQNPRMDFRNLDGDSFEFSYWEELPLTIAQSGENKLYFIGLKGKSLLCDEFTESEKDFVRKIKKNETNDKEIFLISVNDKNVGFWEIYTEKSPEKVRSFFYTYSAAPLQDGSFNQFESTYDETVDLKGALLSGHQVHKDDFLKYEFALEREGVGKYLVVGNYQEKKIKFEKDFKADITSHVGQELIISNELLEKEKRETSVYRFFPALNQYAPIEQKIKRTGEKSLEIIRPGLKIPMVISSEGKTLEVIENYPGFSMRYKRVYPRVN